MKPIKTTSNRANNLVLKGKRFAVSPPSHLEVEWLITPDGKRTLYPDSYLAINLNADHENLVWIRDTGESIRPRSISNPGTITHKQAWQTVDQVVLDNIINCEEKLAEFPNRKKIWTRRLNNWIARGSLISKLSNFPKKPWDTVTAQRWIQNVRSYTPKPTNRRENTFRSKVVRYKDRWSSMTPDSLEEKFLPKGSAIGVEIEYLARCRETDEEGEYDTSTMDFQMPTKEIYGTSFGYDCSLRSSEPYHYGEGREVRIMLRQGRWGRLEKLCEHLKSQGAEVNKSCGLHVHLDVRDLSKTATITRCKRLESALPWLFTLVPSSRRWSRKPCEKYPEGVTNQYCQPYFNEGEKYAAVNMAAYGRSSYGGRKSIEVRVHSSSLNAKKIIRWIELLSIIKDSYLHIHDWESFLESSAPMKLKLWASRRREKFNPVIQEVDVESEQVQEIPELPTPAPESPQMRLPTQADIDAALPPLPQPSTMEEHTNE